MRNAGQSGQRAAGHGETRARKVLIANLELEFHVSPIRISNLNFSNRKFLTIFAAKLCAQGEPRPAFFSRQPPASRLQSLIVTPRLESLVTHTKQKPNRNSNRYKSRFSRPGCVSGRPSLPARRSRGPELIEAFTSHESVASPPASCIAPPPRLTWRLATLPPRSSADASQSQSFAIYPDVFGTNGFCSAASSCKPASNRRGAATSRRHHKLAEKLEARAC